MKKLVRVCLVVIAFFACINTARSQQRHEIIIDSLEHQLLLKKIAKDSLYTLQQITDRLYEVDLVTLDRKFEGYFAKFMELNGRLKLIDPAPYILLQKAREYNKNKQYREQLAVTKQAVSLFDKQHKQISPLLIYIRVIYNYLGDQEGRLAFYQQKLDYYLVNGPFENTAACYHGIGGYYITKAAYNQAINNYLKSGEVFRTFDPAFYANELAVTGNVYDRWGNEEKAKYYVEKLALPLDKRFADKHSISYCYYSVGEIFNHQQQYKKAIDYIDTALMYEDPLNTEIFATLRVIKAIANINLHKPDMALPLLKMAQKVSDSAHYNIYNTTGNLEVAYGFFKYYQEVHDDVQAEKSGLEAVNKATAEGNSSMLLKYLQEMGYFYKAINKPALAASYFEKYFILNKQTEEGLDKYKVAQFEIDQNDRQQKAHIDQLKQEKVLEEYQISRRNYFLWGSLVVLLLISGLLLFIYRQLPTNKKTLVALRKTQTQLIQSEKMASLGELTAGIAHEIQNPLNFVNNFSEVNKEMVDELETELKNGNIVEALAITASIKANEEKINHHGKRADFIVKGMLQHSRTSTGEKQLTDINILADEFLKLSYHGLRAKDKNFNAELVANFDKKLPKVNIAQQDIGRVLLNLFNNAFYAVNQRRKTAEADYKPEVTISTSAEKGNLVIKVKDNGNGIPDAIIDKIMQPFFTTKPTGEGTGLGLSLSYDIVVKGHSGSINIQTKPGEYTEFIITLPIIN